MKKYFSSLCLGILLVTAFLVSFNHVSAADWVAVTSAGSKLWSTVAMSADGSTQTAALNYGYLYRSTDSGITWTELTSAGSKAWNSIAMSADGSTQTAVVTGGYIYRSVDTGLTWSPVISAGVKNWIHVVMSSDGKIQTAIPAHVSGVTDYIYRSTDSGLTWSPVVSAGTNHWNSIAMSADGSMQTIVSIYSILRSTDSGLTWTPVASFPNGYRVAMSADGSIQTAIAVNDYIYRSTNGGLTWAPVTSTIKGPWYNVEVSADGSIQTAITGGGYIYKSIDSGLTWTPETSIGMKNWRSNAMSADGSIQTALVFNGYIHLYGVSIPGPIADTTAPETSISSSVDASGASIANGATTESTVMTVGFTGTDNVAGALTFSCSLDGAVFTSCTSPKVYTGLAIGTHTFSVKATDVAGNVDATPATRSWTVTAPVPPADTVAPDTSISSSVDVLGASITNGGSTIGTGMTIGFTGTDNVAGALTFSCILDGAKATSCTSPIIFTDLAIGNHIFSVEATDAGGNIDATPATYSWTITDGSVPPPTPITSIEQLMAMVNGMSLPGKVTDKLNHSLDIAIKKLNDDKTKNDAKFVCNEISLFIKDVQNAVKKDISQSQADTLINATKLVQIEFGCIPSVAKSQSFLAIIWSAIRPIFAIFGFAN